ncbi:MAG: hypothetical protein ACK50V_01255 [Alphaproteobacteria bacterium]
MENFFRKYKNYFKVAGVVVLASWVFGIFLTLYIFNEIKENREYIDRRHQEVVQSLHEGIEKHKRGSEIMNSVFAESDKETQRTIERLREPMPSFEESKKDQEERFKRIEEENKRTWARIDKNFGKDFKK